MTLLVIALGILVFTAAAALAAGRRPALCSTIAAGGVVLAAAAGVAAAVPVLAGRVAESLRTEWAVPLGEFYLKLDALSAFFLVVILGLSALAGVYGVGYMRGHRDKKPLGPAWFFFNLLVAGMVLVVTARNGVLFLVAWEVMSLASFFLVTLQDEQESVRRAGWTYLVATHIGTAFLLVLFVLIGRQTGTMDFDQIGRLSPLLAGVAFLLAVVGFGTKAGFVPLHVWLPEAHPAAPSHVSAVMSGVMIKTGIYGLLRVIALLGPANQAAWWGWLLVGVGAVSGILGVLFALAQHDLKRLLAYHSVENIGIITLGIGLGLVGVQTNQPVLAVLGFAGGILHVANHAMFKGLLFLGAGAALHATGTRDIDHLGGLGKRMPWTAAAFLVGAVAICGLPPLNGFASEFLIYLGGFKQVLARSGGDGRMPAVLTALAAIAALTAIGGLAAACFTKAFGAVFLGEPRSGHVGHAHEAGWLMRGPMLVLAGGCVVVGLLAPLVVAGMSCVVRDVTGFGPEQVSAGLAAATGPLAWVMAGSGIFGVVLGGLILLRRRLLAGRSVGQAGTWDCGYAQPTARMQYTASSFAQPLVDLFRPVLRTEREFTPPAGLFPPAGEGKFASHTPDVFTHRLYRPVFGAVEWVTSRLRWFQHGRVQLYVLYVAMTVLALLIWALWV